MDIPNNWKLVEYTMLNYYNEEFPIASAQFQSLNIDYHRKFLKVIAKGIVKSAYGNDFEENPTSPLGY